jgi:hypothetical protein
MNAHTEHRFARDTLAGTKRLPGEGRAASDRECRALSQSTGRGWLGGGGIAVGTGRPGGPSGELEGAPLHRAVP